MPWRPTGNTGVRCHWISDAAARGGVREVVRSEVVDVLKRRYKSLENLALKKSSEDGGPVRSGDIKITRGPEPAAGFESAGVSDTPGREANFLSSIAAARQEAQSLFELTRTWERP